MAALNPRVLELVETLAVVGLDWLAFELIESVQVGRSPEEAEEALAAVRDSIRSDAQPIVGGEAYATAVVSTPIPPDEQIEWAAAYVGERLDAAIKQLQVSLDMLNLVADGITERPDEARSAEQSTDPETRVVLLLQDIESGQESARNNVVGARENFLALRAALTEWITQSRGQAST